jgi:hypothetical protein
MDGEQRKTATTQTATIIGDPQWKEFSENLQYLWCDGSAAIAVLPNPPTALEFSRDFVSKSRPCIIRNVFVEEGEGTPKQLTLGDIITTTTTQQQQQEDDRVITVDVTPDGQGDCVRTCRQHGTSTTTHGEEEEIFVQPKEYQMTLSEFRTRLRRQQEQQQPRKTSHDLDIHGRPVLTFHAEEEPSSSATMSNDNNDDADMHNGKTQYSLPPDDSVVYYSRQNDCLRTEFPELQSLFPVGALDWAQQAFGTSLDAVNLWIGNEAAVSSMHKDHYENLFYVASGEKIFTLCPPACVPFLYEHLEYPTAVFDVDVDVDENDHQHQWSIRRIVQGDDGECTKVRWVAPDVTSLMSANDNDHKSSLLERYPLLKHVHPIEVRVQKGDLLYLPSLWFHRVTQSCETVGVNFWYDMHFDSPLWCYYSLLSQLQPTNHSNSNSCE